ncbi:MAG TPA: hypothetical protein VFJ90_03370 [Candidatus Didemnitutus sp.]|nr:hypothetical protein [Candidatus Didemnitutus sp.]
MKNVKTPEEPAPNHRRTIIIAVAVVLAIILAFSFARCSREKSEKAEAARLEAVAKAAAAKKAAEPPPPPVNPEGETVSPATIEAPAQVIAGNVISVKWTGPENPKDYLTIVKKDAADGQYGNYMDIQVGNPLKLTAPIDAGEYEIRYMTTKTKSVLGRAPLTVNPATATLEAADEAVQGSKLKITWTGPNNPKDYITVVAAGAADGQYGNYTYTDKGATLEVTLPVTVGEAEIRYMTGQGGKVLARRPVKVTAADVILLADPQIVAGATLQVTWAGPNNASDYITVVPKATPDGQYGNYTYTAKGSPLNLLMPIMEGEAEIRYMTGQGGKVLGRRPIKIIAAKVTLDAPKDVRAGFQITINWTGPNNPSDYITIVKEIIPEGEHAAYVYTAKGSPVTLTAPTWPGDYEVRYMTGQGNKVLKKRSIRISQ